MPQLNKTANAETNLFFSGNVLYNYLNVNIVFIDILQKSLHYYYDFLIINEFWCFLLVLILWIQQNGEKWELSECNLNLFPSEISFLCVSCTEVGITSHDPNVTYTSVTACGVYWNFGFHSHSTLFPLTDLVFSNCWDRKQKAFKAVRLRLCSKWHSWYVLMVLQTCHGSCACETVEHPIGYFRDFVTAHFAEALMQAPAKLYWTVYAK